MKICSLQCEYKENPIGIDNLSPRFLWKQSGENHACQTAYQIIVSSSEEKAGAFKADVWDSGIVESDLCYGDYTGKKLESSCRYYWRIRICLNHTEWVECSETAYFEMGLLDGALWQGRWIGSPTPERYVSLFRRVVSLDKKPVKARAYIATAGFSELWVNGGKIGVNLLDPSNTDYSKRLLYVTYDITDNLNIGDNAIGVMLNNGWTSHARFLLQIYVWFEDGSRMSLCSEFGNWVMLVSPILSATIYSGEVYNSEYERPDWNLPADSFEKKYHKEYWRVFCDQLPRSRNDNPSQYDQYANACFDVLELPAPGGKLEAQIIEPIKVMEYIQPVSVEKAVDHSFIYTFDQNFAGWVRLKIKGARGTVITIKYTEILNDDGTMNMEYLRVSDPTYPLPMQTDVFILKGKGEEIYEPRFTYHGFKYISIEGVKEAVPLDQVTGVVVHSSVQTSGDFSCSEPIINRLQNMILWTERSNLYSIPTDCPQRSERHGWLNDLTARGEESVYNFNLKLFYTKFENDIKDTQDHFSGAISDTAPYRRGNHPADAVSSSYLILPWLVYMHYSDERLIRDHYEGMKKWTEFLYRNSHDGIISYSLYGDWASPIHHCHHNGFQSPVSSITPGYFISSGFLYFNITTLLDFAIILKKEEDVADLSARKKALKNKLNHVFFNSDTANYANGSQGANVFALYLGIVPKKYIKDVVANIVKDIVKNDYHLTTGNLTTKYLFEVLSMYGEVDTAYKLATQTTYPSWGFMMSNGATTIWERWEYETGYGMNSHNHPMYGSIGAWFYKYLAGISPVEPGYKVFQIKPYMPAGLDHVSASVDTIYGAIRSGWEKKGDSLILDITVPCGSKAFIHIPSGHKPKEIYCNDILAWNNHFVKSREDFTGVAYDEEFAVFEVNPGEYRFRAN